MNAINEEPEPQEIEALLPWYAAGTLSRRDANRVEQALANDRELARQYDLVREELVETIHLNETLGAPSTRAIERLFTAIDAGGARAPPHRRLPNEGSYAVVRFAPQATADDITNFLRAYKTKVVDGPLNTGSALYRIQLSETKLPKEEVGKIIRQMQSESKIVDFIAAKE
jgi:hypothetical protein